MVADDLGSVFNFFRVLVACLSWERILRLREGTIFCGLRKILAIRLIAADNGVPIPTIAHPPETERSLGALRRQNEVKTIIKQRNKQRDRGVYIATTSSVGAGPSESSVLGLMIHRPLMKGLCTGDKLFEPMI